MAPAMATRITGRINCFTKLVAAFASGWRAEKDCGIGLAEDSFMKLIVLPRELVSGGDHVRICRLIAG